jgi:Flp pilus assembly protein TadG
MNPQVSSIRQNPVRNIQRRERGQTLVMFVLFMVALFLFAGLGIDLGFAYITRARLSKAVDSAALAGARNVGQTQPKAIVIADNAFYVNYGTSSRDVSPPVPQAAFSNDAAGNLLLGVTANTTINTFFIRVLPQWSTLTVGSSATALRSKVVLSLVLDRSGSMSNDLGYVALPGAVANFIDLFYENYDRASMSSFSYAPSTDVAMETVFKTDIKNKANGLTYDGWTCSERGLTNGLAQNAPVVINLGESVIKVIVFFTDGLANTWYYDKFNCGARDMSPDKDLWDPVTGAHEANNCTVPPTIPSIDPTVGTINTSHECTDMYVESEARARAIATLARSQGIIVYAIGMGDPSSGFLECGHPPLNPSFLEDLANTTNAPHYNASQSQYSGDYAIATDASALNDVFQTIASKILLRLTR